MNKTFRKYLSIPLFILLVYGLLMIPDNSEPEVRLAGNSAPFIWNQDDRWEYLEQLFNEARNADEEWVHEEAARLFSQNDSLFTRASEGNPEAESDTLSQILNVFFRTAPYAALSDQGPERLSEIYNRNRKFIKQRSADWDLDDPEKMDRLYQYLYGMRAAVEEVMLQQKDEPDPVLYVEDVPSETPSTRILGITVHSGDLLVSRGGAEVSALISRGNDHPGNFSHVALIYIDQQSNIPYLIEAHIERGVAVANLEEYISDRKLRFMVLRMRPEQQIMKEDPMLPHKAAKRMFDEVRERHIPYDFRMDHTDPEAMFCSEVGSFAYASCGVQLWNYESTISSAGIVDLLNTFGVTYFTTQMPSDLEYDPQLSVVAEWRDAESLFEDHIYNAVIDAMLICADNGAKVSYDAWMLPLGRVVKGYSMLLNLFEKTGPVPEGMSATQALKNNSFVQSHRNIRQEVYRRSEIFIQEKGYRPPYWELVKMAENSATCDF